MYKIKKLPEETLYFKNKVISHKNKDFKTHLARWVIQRIKENKDLKSYPTDYERFPLLADVLLHIDNDPKLSEEKSKASAVQIALLREDLLYYTNLYKRETTAENEKIVDKTYKTYMAFSKNEANNETFVLVLENLFEEDYWKFGPLPENPRIDSRDCTYEEWVAYMGKKLKLREKNEKNNS